ncbi:MAG TPA: GGDEF domain-containing protein, partial [Oceanicaulis sp.]|nr:GGDEF domain-containing protein [Oceanicaulis sp.]
MRSLVMKFTLLCGVILVAATTALMAVEYQLKSQDNNSAGLVHAELITELFTSTAANAIAVSDIEGLTNRLLADFGARPDVSSVYVADVNGRVIALNGEVPYGVGDR